MKQNKRKHDNVVAVGEVEGHTLQVLIPDGFVSKFMWRIIYSTGKSVTSGEVLYDSVDDAFGAAVQIILPDAVPVEYVEPGAEDFEALGAMLFGFKKGDPISTFGEVMVAHNFLMETVSVLKQAAAKLPGDYDRLDAAWCEWYDDEADEVLLLRQLKQLAVQSQGVMIELCERDLETLSVFISGFVKL